jgi:ribonuclease BN (tRNA processing enzyme)
MGPGAMRQFKGAGLDYERLDQIFITHFHPDHTADLIHFLFASRNPAVYARRKPVSVTGPKGLDDFIKGLQQAYQNWLDLSSEMLQIVELDQRGTIERDYGNFRLSAAPVKHTGASLAYRFEDAVGRSFVCSGDTGFCEEIIALADRADLLVLECSFPDDQPVEGHLTPSLAGRIARLARVEKLVLTHFYPECLRTDIAAHCRKEYGGELILASDLMHTQVR